MRWPTKDNMADNFQLNKEEVNHFKPIVGNNKDKKYVVNYQQRSAQLEVSTTCVNCQDNFAQLRLSKN